MTAYAASAINLAPRSEPGNVYFDQAVITGTAVEGDIWRFLVIPAGTEIHSITVQNEALATAAPFDLGYAPVDGSTGDADAFLNDYAGDVAAAAGAAVTYMLTTPVKVEEDSYLQAVFGTIDTAAEKYLCIQINGKLLGPK